MSLAHGCDLNRTIRVYIRDFAELEHPSLISLVVYIDVKHHVYLLEHFKVCFSFFLLFVHYVIVVHLIVPKFLSKCTTPSTFVISFRGGR